MTKGPERLLTVVQELAEVSRLVEDDDVAAVLERFVARLVVTVPGCAAATVMLREQERVEALAVARDDGQKAPPASLLADLGPIDEALQHREPRRIDDTQTDQRWPGFSALLADERYRSCLVLPLPTRSSRAVLTLYSRQPHQFDETVHDIVLLLTLHAGVVFDNAQLFHDSQRLVEQLRTALENRQTIGQAQGLLMRHLGCNSDHGFELLRSISQNTNTKLRDVATGLIGAHEQNDFAKALTKFNLDPDVAGAGAV